MRVIFAAVKKKKNLSIHDSFLSSADKKLTETGASWKSQRYTLVPYTQTHTHILNNLSQLFVGLIVMKLY